MWVCPVEPGSTHDLSAARAHVPLTPYKATSQGLRTLADNGYQGTGIGVLTPVKSTRPCPDHATYNQFCTALRSPPKEPTSCSSTIRADQRLNLNSQAITTTIATALVIINLNNDPR